jgi:hypothetical protein
MADEDEAGDAQAGLTFNNDGSFMEQFMKMQKEKEKSSEAAESTKKDSPSLATVKPVRKPPASLAQKMMKNRAAKKLAAASAGKEGGAESKKESVLLSANQPRSPLRLASLHLNHNQPPPRLKV